MSDSVYDSKSRIERKEEPLRIAHLPGEFQAWRKILRAHIASQEYPCNKGWLRAVFDPQIGPALKSRHENLAPPWTAESLAAARGMSRPAFAQKFKDLVGEAPLEYLTNWRMQKAIALLRDEDKKLFGVAKSVGYDSDAAFS